MIQFIFLIQLRLIHYAITLSPSLSVSLLARDTHSVPPVYTSPLTVWESTESHGSASMVRCIAIAPRHAAQALSAARLTQYLLHNLEKASFARQPSPAFLHFPPFLCLAVPGLYASTRSCVGCARRKTRSLKKWSVVKWWLLCSVTYSL